MKKAFVVPHPPIILPEVGRGEEEKIAKSIEAYERVAEEIAEIKPETIIISSPHAPYYQDAFYLADAPRARGNLRAFGIGDVEEEVLIDQELCDEIVRASEDLPIYYSKKGAKNLDHGTLIPLRFIKARYQDFKIIRLGISVLPAETHYQLGMSIKSAVKKLGRNCAYIASGDLSHVLKSEGPYGYREAGPVFDKKIVDILRRAAFDELLNISRAEAEEAAQCGLGSFQIMAGFLNGEKVKAEEYSYEGPFGVGYAVFSFDTAGDDPDRYFLINRYKKFDKSDSYIELAREAIKNFIRDDNIISPPQGLPKAMTHQRAGCFVTLHKFGKLRGCIGTIAPTRENIADEIIQNAISASTRDPRFPSVKENELDDLKISVDILGDPEPIHSMNELDTTTYGVIVTSGYRRGLLLPNLEGIDTPKKQVAIALQKAGIYPDENFQMERFKVIRHEYDE